MPVTPQEVDNLRLNTIDRVKVDKMVEEIDQSLTNFDYVTNCLMAKDSDPHYNFVFRKCAWKTFTPAESTFIKNAYSAWGAVEITPFIEDDYHSRVDNNVAVQISLYYKSDLHLRPQPSAE